MIGFLPNSSRNLSELTKLGTCSLFSRVYGLSHHFSTDVQPSREKTQFQLDCETLNVPETCDADQARSAFIKAAKKYHPDGKTKDANAEKFQEISSAYKNLLKKFADERHNQHVIEGEYGLYYEFKKKVEKARNVDKEEADNNTIEHTAPQHRRYLNHEGVGTVFQRQKQHQKSRAVKAAAAVYDHRINQMTKNDGNETVEMALVNKDKESARKNKTSHGIERMVEDLIQESMARGEFDNLKGQGKPLKHDTSYNPYIDFTTHKLNQVLIDNGFTPEWILLEKEIRQGIKEVRERLSQERHKYEETMTMTDCSKWKDFVAGTMKPTVDGLNEKIQKFNLIVPIIHRQLFCLQLDREAAKALKNFSLDLHSASINKMSKVSDRSQLSATDQSDQSSLMDFVFSAFKIG